MPSLIFYKPYEVLSQFSESGTKKTLAHFFKNLSKDIYPVGRLDYDSEGLLILSSDKQLSHQLTDPRFGHPRTYYVQVEAAITAEALKQLSDGVIIRIEGKEYRTKKAVARLIDEGPELPERIPPIRIRKSVPTSWISLQLTEGKNRQVRRMTAAVGFPTLRLVRFSIGELNIQGMHPGDYATLDDKQIQQILRK